jgi:hypothetical protein
MSEQVQPGDEPTADAGPHCQWCSAALPTATEVTCPSCGASLHEEPTAEIPGVTRVDLEAILKARAAQPRNRGLIGWLSGAYDEGSAVAAGSVAPPPDEVRREMLRLEMAALEAENRARRAEIDAELAEMAETSGTAAATDEVTDAAEMAEAPAQEPPA